MNYSVSSDRRARQFAGVPTGYGLAVPVALKQFGPANHLRILWIPNLEPSALLAVADVGAVPVLRDDALQVQFADALEEGPAGAVHVVRIQRVLTYKSPDASMVGTVSSPVQYFRRGDGRFLSLDAAARDAVMNLAFTVAAPDKVTVWR